MLYYGYDIYYLFTNGEAVYSQGKIRLSSKKTFTSRLLNNLFKLKMLDPIRFIKLDSSNCRPQREYQNQQMF